MTTENINDEQQKMTDIDTADLLVFLKQNPNVFEQHPELLELVTLSDTRGTTSLLERQIEVLKTRLQQQKSSQSELFKVARENEQISDNFSEIVYQMIGFTTLTEFVTQFPNALRNIFSIDEVSFKTQQGVERKSEDKQVYSDTIRRLVKNRAVCDNRWPSSIMKLFFTNEVQSAALIPMRNNDSDKPLGILALGSKNPNRYTHDLGTTHLDKLGLMSGICLSRLQLKLNVTQEIKT